jgi:hypothetical protein
MTAGDTKTTTWAGFTERVDTSDTIQASFSAADYTNTAAQTPLTVGCDWTGSDDAIGVAASFR